ncbi:MAG TPA: hypothetical protein VFR53_09235 [Methylomirabilota bacterium]|nr:hypothetical protein [Methylomirabilota bacterium]
MTRRALTRRLLIGVRAAAVMGMSGLWWLGSQLVKPLPHAVPLPADFPARALTIPGTRIAAWWLDQGAGTPSVLLLHAKGGDLTPLLLVQLRVRLDVSAADLEPIRSMSRLGAPVLVVAGSQDRHTTAAESEDRFRSAVEPKQLWVVDGARHQDLLAYDPARYESRVVGFLRPYL